MSITDELRMYVQDWRDTPSLMDDLDRGDVDGILIDFIRIADRIDAAHEKDVTVAHSNGITKYGSMVAREYVKLPVDADGVPIRVGDELTNGIDLPAKVRGMVMGKDGWVVGSRALGVDGMVDPTTLHHIQPDTWDRIIEDAANLVRGDNESVVGLVERCRRLAGEV